MKRLLLLIGIVAIILVSLLYISIVKSKRPLPMTTNQSQQTHTLQLKSSAFSHNSSIPLQYTCEGKDMSPPLAISGAPNIAKSLVLIVDDPDAPLGTWTHWVVFNIDPKISKIEENSVPRGALLGKNSFGRESWGGPCPPSGTHRYFFKLSALDTMLNLNHGASRQDIEQAVNSHVIDHTDLVGLYKKQK